MRVSIPTLCMGWRALEALDQDIHCFPSTIYMFSSRDLDDLTGIFPTSRTDITRIINIDWDDDIVNRVLFFNGNLVLELLFVSNSHN